MRKIGEFPRSPGEYYGTPGWITRALLVSEALPDRLWEPCAGDGKMVDVLRQHGRHVVASDIEPRGEGIEQRDFLAAGSVPEGVAAIVTNPPWDSRGRLSTAVVRHALRLMAPGHGLVAMLVPLAWDAAKSRRDLFMQPSYVAEVALLDRMQVMEGTMVDKGITSTIQATWHVWDLSRQRRNGIRKHFVTKSDANRLCEVRFGSDPCRTAARRAAGRPKKGPVGQTELFA